MSYESMRSSCGFIFLVSELIVVFTVSFVQLISISLQCYHCNRHQSKFSILCLQLLVLSILLEPCSPATRKPLNVFPRSVSEGSLKLGSTILSGSLKFPHVEVRNQCPTGLRGSDCHIQTRGKAAYQANEVVLW